MHTTARLAIFYTALVLAAGVLAAQTIDLPSSKQLIGETPGHPQRLNSLPISIAVSPDSRYVVTVNAGFGVFESQYMQSLTVLDTQNATQSGAVVDFPDSRTLVRAKQTLFSGLAFSRDGHHLYASMASLTDPLDNGKDLTGNAIVVYRFAEGKITPERLIPLPLQQLSPGKTTKLPGGTDSDKGIPYPAAIAVLGSAGAEKLLVADNLSDDVLLLDAASGKIETRFDLAESDAVPSTYPIALMVSKDGARAFVALWNASEIVELDLAKRTVGRKLALLKPSSPMAPGTHPCVFQLSPDGRTLYVALANRDAVAAVNVNAGQFSVKGYFSTRLPRQSYFGAEPVALAVNASGSRLYAANMGSDAVAVLDTNMLTSRTARRAMVNPLGFIPTEWMPISMIFSGGKLYLATGKGKGAGPNNMPQPPTEAAKNSRLLRPFTYIATLLYGSLATLDEAGIDKNLLQWTETVLTSNRMKAADEKIVFAGGAPNPIRHVIYIIKENRTYDQLLGDLSKDGKPVANGDPSLTMYGEAVTPNQHKLALQFGVLDNFYDSAEVSSGGHVWSNAAIGTDYLERTWQQGYRGGQRTYDSEGMVADGNPLLQRIPDVSDPASGYIWNNLAAHGKTYYHFAEYISSIFCNAAKVTDPQQGAMLPSGDCPRNAVAPGETFPREWGGGVNKWPWPIPLLSSNTATKQELVGHFAVEAPDFNLMVPDQVRAEVFLRHLNSWVADKAQGKDTMPNFILMRLPNDHTLGTRPGGPSPKSSVADNDLAVGRVVEAVSHSPFWDDTAICILEDDAQNGGDHVDAHRSIALVVSKYSPHGPNSAQFPNGAPFVDSRFYTTVSMIRTMESLLGLPPMNNNDAFSSLISTLFTGPGDQPAYIADYSNRDNGLIYTANPPTAAGARESMKMDFTHADRAPADKLNVILWKDAMGDKPVPAMLKVHHKKSTTDDDD
jgi:DNA-binding beta-propeller fold protein YncE